jgi:mannose-6-phosphate isomerase-like protein (cupin superfamily)
MEEQRPFWLDVDGGDTIQFFDQGYRVKAAGAQTGGSFGLVEVSTPQGSGPPPHVHEREDEAFYVLEGSYEVTVGNDRFDAREGGGAAPAPAVFAELAKERGVTLLGPPPAP